MAEIFVVSLSVRSFPYFLCAVGLHMVAAGCASRFGKKACGLARVIFTVVGPTASTFLTSSPNIAQPVFAFSGPMKRWKLYTTAAASNAVPSWNLTFFCSSKVQVKPSLDVCQLAASPGSNSRVSPLKRTRFS